MFLFESDANMSLHLLQSIFPTIFFFFIPCEFFVEEMGPSELTSLKFVDYVPVV